MTLMIAERALGGLVHPAKIEEMNTELTKVIEDFDRAVNVEAFRLVKQIGEHTILFHPGDSLFSVVLCRARAFTWAA